MKLLSTRGPLLPALAATWLTATAAVHVDTVGITGVDYQNYGPAWQRVFNLPGSGVYVAWLKTGMAANYYDCATRAWRGEVDVFGSLRNAAGNLDVSLRPGPYRGSTFISSWLSRDPKWPVVAVESAPGSSAFVVRATDSTVMGCQRPPVAFTADGWLHMLCVDSATGDTLLYSRSTDFGTNWSTPVPVCGSAPPIDPTHNICASDSTSRVAAVWSVAAEQALWLNVSNDGGNAWSGPQNLLPVPSSIPGARPGRLGGSGLFDREDRLNVVTQVWDGTSQHPAEIWHWREGRSPAWSLVRRFAPGRVIAPCEPDEPFALRPSVAQRRVDGRLFVAWMNYDSANYESQTQLARADVFVSQSTDNGASWSRPLRLTGPDNGSRLAPSLASTAADTLVVACVTDRLAGIFELGHGGQTTNTVNVLFVPVADIPGVAEGPSVAAAPRPVPTLVRGVLELRPRAHGPPPPAVLLEATGRVVARLRPGANDVRHLAPGVYFVCCPGTAARVIVTR